MLDKQVLLIFATAARLLKFYEELKRRNVLRVAAGYLAASWILVQLMEALLPIFGLPETAGRPVVVILIVGFIPALIIAWYFEFTTEGIRKDSEVDHSAKEARRTYKAADTTIVVMLLIAVSYFAIDKFILSPARVSNNTQAATTLARSIAVLAFDDLSPGNDQEYFSDGLSEELLNLLARIPDLRVAARTSSFAFKGKDVQIGEIAETLSVGHVLEGSVRMSGDQIRITAQLINAEDGFHVWSETYDRTLDDIFTVQDDIAARVVEVLEVTLLNPPPKTRTTNPIAYQLFLRARHLGQQYTPESFERAATLLKEVLDVDPEYVPAWTQLAGVYVNQATSGLVPISETMVEAKVAAEKAAEIDPTFAGAYAQLGWIAHVYDGELNSAAQFYEQALALDPTNEVIIGNAAVLAESLGRLDQAIRMKQYLADRATTSSIAHNNLGLAYYYARRLQEAEEALRTTVLMSPDYIGANYRLGTVLLHREEFEAALDTYKRESDDEYRTKGKALALYALGQREAADSMLQTLIDDFGDLWPTEVAQVYAYRGNLDKAFEWLELKYEKDLASKESDGAWGEQRLDLLFQNLYDDPRWETFLEKLGVSDAQLEQIEFNVKLPELTL